MYRTYCKQSANLSGLAISGTYRFSRLNFFSNLQGFARAGIVPVDAAVFSQDNAGQDQGHHRSWNSLNIE